MIMGLSHIAISTDDIEAASARLAGFGYQQRFDEPALENHVAKQTMLTRHQPQHHIRALAAEGAMAVELLDHGGMTGDQAAALIPVLRAAQPAEGWQMIDRDALPLSDAGWDRLTGALGATPHAVFDPVLSMRLLWLPCAAGEAEGITACAMPTPDLPATEAMLSQLRFRADASGLWSLLTPLPALQARVVPVDYAACVGWSDRPLLDAPGAACLALMARGTDKAPLPAALQGDSVSFTLPVNGKTSRITLARPAHGPIIEMVDQSS
jgi:hypothetical protein